MVLCFVFFLVLALSGSGAGEAALVEHTFVVSQMKLNHLCNETLVTLVNEQLPGPAIEVMEGDSVVVHVINKSPTGVTIHWHGVKQYLNCWADGPGMITQCPIQPNMNFTYRFNVTSQEGTLWWHAHLGFLRATIHGALIIRPRAGPNLYPFSKPDKEIPIVIAEWWDVDLVQMEKRVASRIYGDRPRSATINGMLGDLNNCSGVIEDNYILDFEHGKTYLLRIVNAALHGEYSFRIARHKFTVVAVDANYVKPYTTDTIMIASGETVDALVNADALPGRYYMVVHATESSNPSPMNQVLMSRGIVSYSPRTWSDDDTRIVAPRLPDEYDTSPSFYFHGNLTSLLPQLVPAKVDVQLLISIDTGKNCLYVGSPDCAVSMLNGISFQLPTKTSLLHAFYYDNMSSISMLQELPKRSPLVELYPIPASIATAVRKVQYNATVEIVFQGQLPPNSFSNPMHLHGHDFYILAQGLGIFDIEKDEKKYNLVDPPMRNTAHVPKNGWMSIRFIANNPGVWFLHCHIEHHAMEGMAMALIVEDGPTFDTSLSPPPIDYPSCNGKTSVVAFE